MRYKNIPVDLLKEFFSVESLDARIKPQKRKNQLTPSTKISISSATTTTAPAAPANTTFTTIQKARWNTYEFKFYYLAFIIVIPMMFITAINASTERNVVNYYKFERLLSKGWLFGRKVDNSDAQYRFFRDNFPLLITLILSHVLFKRFILIITDVSRLKFDMFFGLLFLFIAHGFNSLRILAHMLVMYSIVHLLKRRRHWATCLTWVYGILTLFINDKYRNLPFGSLLPFLKPIDQLKFNGIIERWDVFFNFTLLRLISYNLDYLERWDNQFKALKKNDIGIGNDNDSLIQEDLSLQKSNRLNSVDISLPTILEDGNKLQNYMHNSTNANTNTNNIYRSNCNHGGNSEINNQIGKNNSISTNSNVYDNYYDIELLTNERARLVAPHHIQEYSINNFIAYVLYTPLYIAGPIITFNDYVYQSKNTLPSINKIRIGKYLIRLILTILVMEFILHFTYVVAVSKTKAWEGDSPFQISMIGLFNLNIIYLKLLIPWRLFRLWGLLDGIDTPENMIRLVDNNYSALAFWRAWHRSYNKWVVRYIYIPLGGSKNRILTSLAVFSFVAIWHDIELKLLFWGWLIVLFLIPEIVTTEVFQPYRQEWWYRHACALGAVVNIWMMMIANLFGFCLGPDGTKALLWDMFSTGNGLSFFVLASGCIFIAVQIMFEIREEEKRNGIFLKC